MEPSLRVADNTHAFECMACAFEWRDYPGSLPGHYDRRAVAGCPRCGHVYWEWISGPCPKNYPGTELFDPRMVLPENVFFRRDLIEGRVPEGKVVIRKLEKRLA